MTLFAQIEKHLPTSDSRGRVLQRRSRRTHKTRRSGSPSRKRDYSICRSGIEDTKGDVSLIAEDQQQIETDEEDKMLLTEWLENELRYSRKKNEKFEQELKTLRETMVAQRAKRKKLTSMLATEKKLTEGLLSKRYLKDDESESHILKKLQEELKAEKAVHSNLRNQFNSLSEATRVLIEDNDAHIKNKEEMQQLIDDVVSKLEVEIRNKEDLLSKQSSMKKDFEDLNHKLVEERRIYKFYCQNYPQRRMRLDSCKLSCSNSRVEKN